MATYKEKGGRHIQSVVPAYHEFVLEGLIGTEGTSKSDVIAALIRDWIKSNKKEIEGLGLTISHWKKTSGRGPSAESKVIEYPSPQKRKD